MKLSDIKNIVGGEIYGTDTSFVGAAYDSREVCGGNIFVCLKGERTDGHLYINSAAKNGAVAAICQKKVDTSLPYILVDDTIAALQKIASFYKDTLSLKTVAITGSVGKTTTKEFLSAVLLSRLKVHKTEGNRNSHIGLPVTLLDIPSEAEVAVLEMGMSGFGEISLLSKIAKPNIGVITNIGFSHLEYLGSRENIMKAKLEIVDGMDKNGILILNGDDEFLSTVKPSSFTQKIIFYGIGANKADYRASDILFKNGCCHFLAVTPNGSFEAEIPTEGLHNVYNALSSIVVGSVLGLSNEEIRSGLKNYKNPPLRQNIYEINGVTVIEDCYNASPASIKAALDVLRLRSGRKIAVLGDMLELGEKAGELHEMTGESLFGIDILISFGNFNSNYIKGAEKAGVNAKNCYSCKNTKEASDVLINLADKGDTILFKASRGMQAEEIIKNFANCVKTIKF